MDQKFYICETCGKIVAIVKDTQVPLVCCGSKMKELIPGTTEASTEKHIPVYTVEGNIVTVTVGSQTFTFEKKDVALVRLRVEF